MKLRLIDKLRAIEEYQKNGNLKTVAKNFGIHPSTLFRWIEKFNNKTETYYVPPWNRFDKKIEERIMLLKENNPSLSVYQAQQKLSKTGIRVSLKGIYSVWSRYNLINRLVDDPFSHFCAETQETKNALEYVQHLLKKDKSDETLKKAAQIINQLPSYPKDYDNIILELPEEYLSLRRRFDRLYCLFLKMPTPKFYKKIHSLRIQMEKKGLYYSSIIAGLSEILALHWMRTPEKELSLNELLTKRKGSLRDPILNFQLAFLAATAKIELMQIDEAKVLLRKARRLLSYLPYSSFYESFGDAMTFMSDYHTALVYHQKALEMADEVESKNRLYFKIALNLTIGGKHRGAIRYLKLAKIDPSDKYYESYALTRVLISFGLGKLEQSELFIQKTLEQSEKQGFRNTIFTAICCLSAIKRALGNIEESNQLLKDYLPLMKKYKIQREAIIMQFLLERKLERLNALPTICILHLIQQAKASLKESDYKNIFAYARKYGIIGYLHRCLFFVPELVLHHLAKGRDVMLPKSLVQLPIFDKNFPFYELKFLGITIIHRNHAYLKVQISPQINGLLINLSLRLREPGSSMNVETIISNFWQKSKAPMKRFYDLLVQVRSLLKLPSHFLRIENRDYEKYLVNRGFYIWTDYNYFTIQLAQAKALERAGEWGFAKREYLRAFRLFRGEPFKKNFDEWSLNMRYKILTQLETEAVNFAKSCIEHGDKATAKKILQKVSRIIPDSEEVNNLLKL